MTMKRKNTYLTLIPIFCMALTGCMKEDPEYFKKPDWWTPEEEDAGTGEYRLVWSDEFVMDPQSGMDWTYPSDDWTFETGGTGWGNDEAQYYVCLLYTSPSPRD